MLVVLRVEQRDEWPVSTRINADVSGGAPGPRRGGPGPPSVNDVMRRAGSYHAPSHQTTPLSQSDVPPISATVGAIQTNHGCSPSLSREFAAAMKLNTVI